MKSSNQERKSTSKMYKRNESKNPKKVREVLNNFKIRAHTNLLQKYQTDDNSLNLKTINDIIYNEKAHIVASFKDFLIFDDTSEFLKRYYKVYEANQRLPKIFEFYESFSKIFANYIILPESKYMYKNIQRKQKMIDNIQKMQNDENLTTEKDSDKIFNTEIYNSIMNQTTQHEENTTANKNCANLIQHMINNSVDSIEMLIDCIGKAEVIKGNMNSLNNNFNTIYSNTSEGNMLQSNKVNERQTPFAVTNSKFTQREMNKVHSPSPSITSTNNLFNNINSFNKNKVSVLDSGKNKLKVINEVNVPATNVISVAQNKKNSNAQNLQNNILINNKFEKIVVSKRGDKTDRYNERSEKNRLNLGNSNPNSNHNTIIASSSSGMSKPCIINSTGINNQKEKQTNNTKQANNNSNHNPKNPSNNPTHKSTLSMPKLSTSNMYNNFNFGNNYQSTVTSSIDKNLINNLITSNPNPIHSKNSEMSNSKTLSNKPSERGALLSTINSMNNCTNTNSKESLRNSGVIKNDINKYIKSYTSDISKIKKKVANLVNDSTMSKLNQRITNNSGLSGLMSNRNSAINSVNNTHNTHTISALNTINVHNNSGSRIKNSVIERKKDRTKSMTGRQLENIKENTGNSIRAMLQRELFEGEVNNDRVLKKNIVENTKVYTRPESKIRDNLISRNSQEKIGLDNTKDTKEKHLAVNTSNNNTKSYSIMNITDRKSMNHYPNTNLSSPKGVGSNNHQHNNNNNTFLKSYHDIHNETHTNTHTFNKNSSINGNTLAVVNEQNGIKNLKKVSVGLGLGTGIKAITTVQGGGNNHSNNNHHTLTPTKHIANQSKLGHTNQNHNHNHNHNHIFTKAPETARKLQDNKIHSNTKNNLGTNININNKDNTPITTGTKNVMKIKNFYDVVKNVNVPSNSLSARTNYTQKPELLLSQKKNIKKFL